MELYLVVPKGSVIQVKHPKPLATGLLSQVDVRELIPNLYLLVTLKVQVYNRFEFVILSIFESFLNRCTFPKKWIP